MRNLKHNTYFEIIQQPKVWKKVFELVKDLSSDLSIFLKNAISTENSEIILTGAGSSFFVAETASVIFQNNTGFTSRAVSSTELVTHPHLFINKNKKTLLISFARSGNSPESIGAVDFAEEISINISHLIITCNKKGKLALKKYKNKSFILSLPDETNDKGLAMTSSVSSMILTSLLVSRIESINKIYSEIIQMADFGSFLISEYEKKIEELSSNNFTRAVFLGSGPFIGIAREGHLKLQELTDGKLICKFDSFLGFRHGPKAVVNDETLMVYIMSNDKYVRKYETDLIKSVQNEQNPKLSIVISETYETFKNISLNISRNNTQSVLNEEMLSICSLIPLQLLGYYKSINCGLNPDTPSISGAIHRVVQGVIIYPYNKGKRTVQTQQI